MLTVITDSDSAVLRHHGTTTALARTGSFGTQPAHVRGGIDRCVRMTTFDDTDLFSEAFHDFRGVGSSRRRPALVTPVVMVAAALLVAAGFVWARGWPAGRRHHRRRVRRSCPQFAAGQTRRGPVVAGRPARPARRPAHHPVPHARRPRAALRRRRDLGDRSAWSTVPTGELPGISCARPRRPPGVAVRRRRLLVVASSGPVPRRRERLARGGPRRLRERLSGSLGQAGAAHRARRHR